MLLPSIGILKSQRKNGEKKRTLIFRTKNQLFKKKKNSFIHIKETRTCNRAKRQRLEIIKRLVFSISLSHFPLTFLHFPSLSLSKNSLAFSHFPRKPIFKSRKFSPQESGFPYHKNIQIHFPSLKSSLFNSRNGFKDFPQKI